jgi:hypothetical protein
MLNRQRRHCGENGCAGIAEQFIGSFHPLLLAGAVALFKVAQTLCRLLLRREQNPLESGADCALARLMQG